VKNRFAAAVALSAALMLGTTGCTFSAEIATQKDYDPSDGVGTDIGDLSLRNILLIGEDGDALNLVMTVVSASGSSQRLNVQWEADGGRVTESVFASANGRTVIGGPEQPQLLVTDAGGELGGLVPLYFSYGSETGREVMVPVLNGSLPEYELYVPAVPATDD
jgi:hypothetical protein